MPIQRRFDKNKRRRISAYHQINNYPKHLNYLMFQPKRSISIEGQVFLKINSMQIDLNRLCGGIHSDVNSPDCLEHLFRWAIVNG